MRRLILFLFLLAAAQTLNAQSDSVKAPYQKFKTFPQIHVLLPDSATYFTREDLPNKTPIMLMLFSPICEHCKHETEMILENIDKFSNYTILMVTSMPFDTMRHFYNHYNLAQYKNIIVGYDPTYFLITYFNINQIPFMAFYDKKKEFISTFDGNIPIDKALIELKKGGD
jgi:hypothetical protein